MTSNEKANAQYVPSFRIEDNILIGAEETYPECTNIGELILDKLRNKPDFVGQVEIASGKESTYAEIRERSIKCALWLRKHGIQKGDKVGIWTGNHIDTYIPVYASLYVAAVICPWDDKVSKISARYCLSLISPKVVFANANSVENLVEAAKEENLQVKIVVIGSLPGFVSLTDILHDQVTQSEIDEFRCTVVDNPRDTAIICASSGTTGMPKGTELSYVSFYNSITAIEEVNMINEVSLWFPTIRWHCGLTMLFELIMSNAKWIIASKEIISNEAQLCKVIQDNGVTWFGCDTSFAHYLLKHNILQKYPMSSLKKLVVTGAPFTKEIQEATAKIMPHTQILNCYGLTDAGGLCASQAKNSKPGSCGFVTKGIRIKVVDEKTGKVLGPNERGELCIKSEFIMNGYHKNLEDTKSAIDSNGWLHTKDIVYYDKEGEIFFVNRISNFINYHGIKLSPVEIEGILEIHPSVLSAAVVPVPNEKNIEHPMAFIQKVTGKEVTEQELHDLVDKNLPGYCKLVGGIKFMDKLPRVSTGKIDRKQLKVIAKNYAN
ncbi:PREDICTED: luciferin 4-monooxygenase-like [Vollenhovia emeryi]|uniref:luciferin 4-monooxygenase-like n=1 Tax=Vollenhovia emeryi TaxID=411798 RepID=UPI0005F38722|nr:PREDICTED: luciferin 4-monooxygenase-like [Vollenhovia emeryi]